MHSRWSLVMNTRYVIDIDYAFLSPLGLILDLVFYFCMVLIFQFSWSWNLSCFICFVREGRKYANLSI